MASNATSEPRWRRFQGQAAPRSQGREPGRAKAAGPLGARSATLRLPRAGSQPSSRAAHHAGRQPLRPRVFPQTIESQQFRDYGRRGKVVDIERYAAGLGDKLRSHCPQHLQPGEPAIILPASAAISPPQPRQIHFARNCRRGVRLCRRRVRSSGTGRISFAQSLARDVRCRG